MNKFGFQPLFSFSSEHVHYVEIIVRGGLGNQLFCLHHAYKQILLGNRVSFNLLAYRGKKKEIRQYSLSQIIDLQCRGILISNHKLVSQIYVVSRIINKLQGRFLASSNDRISGDIISVIPLSFNRSIHIGYFQKITSSTVDLAALEMLKSDVCRRLDTNKKLRTLAVHIRLGDYLSTSHSLHGIISMDSIQKEIFRICATTEIDSIIIFTDSPDLVDPSFFYVKGIQVSIDSSQTVYDLMLNMLSCTHLIAANSTFSLWAGLLGNYEEFVIPDKWCKDCTSELLGLEWLKRYEADLSV